MKILVTGGAGFIGSHIVDRYIELGHHVIVVDNLATGDETNVNPAARFYPLDVRTAEFVRLVRSERPEIINHHAAQTLVRISTERPVFDADVNVLGIINLLQAAASAGVRKVIFASSGGTVYGTRDVLPITEDTPFAPQSPYGISKTASEFYLRYYATNMDLFCTTLRYANIFGPRDTVSSEHVITVFATQMIQGETPTIHWDGEQAKDYLYVEDVVSANVQALTKGDNEAYNLGAGRAISVNAIFQQVRDILGVDITPQYGPKRLGDVRLFYLASSKAQRELGWRPMVPFFEGLEQTLLWYQQHHSRP